MFPRDIVCLRNMSISTLHKGDDDDDDNDNDDDDDDNNNNNNNNNCGCSIIRTELLIMGQIHCKTQN